jgi:DNA-binding PadR family transcriptional regulator
LDGDLNTGVLSYDEVKKTSELVHPIWEAGVLHCLLEGPQRYTDIGTWLGVWSGIRPADGIITRSTGSLVAGGYVTRTETGRGKRRWLYEITDKGRERARLLAELIAFFNARD